MSATRIAMLIAGLVVTLFIVIGIAGTSSVLVPGEATPAPGVTDTTLPDPDAVEAADGLPDADQSPAPPPAPPYTPVPTDFLVTITVVEKQCFGSAGCNVTIAVEPTYVGILPLDPTQAYTVIYEVQGGSDVLIDRFEVTGGMATYTPEHFISTDTEAAELIAVITTVT